MLREWPNHQEISQRFSVPRPYFRILSDSLLNVVFGIRLAVIHRKRPYQLTTAVPKPVLRRWFHLLLFRVGLASKLRFTPGTRVSSIHNHRAYAIFTEMYWTYMNSKNMWFLSQTFSAHLRTSLKDSGCWRNISIISDIRAGLPFVVGKRRPKSTITRSITFHRQSCVGN